MVLKRLQQIQNNLQDQLKNYEYLPDSQTFYSRRITILCPSPFKDYQFLALQNKKYSDITWSRKKIQ
jgi:hypothetical protein